MESKQQKEQLQNSSTEKIDENLKYLKEEIYNKKAAEGAHGDNLSKVKRMFGSIIGAFVGDAAGAVLEFMELVTDAHVQEALKFEGGGVFKVGPGQITDDSEMAMCLLHGIGGTYFAPKESTRDTPLESHSQVEIQEKKLPLDLDRIQWYFKNWMKSSPFDIGMTTRSALSVIIPLHKPDPEVSFANTQQKTAASQSNGCLMRITPLAVFCSQLNQKDMYRAVRLQTLFTHSNENAVGACYLYTFAISKLIQGIDGPTVYDLTKKEAQKNDDLKMYGVNQELSSWFEKIDKGIDVPCAGFNIGYLHIAFHWSFNYLKNGIPYDIAIADILSKAGDTDTNAAIVGGLLGAQGINNIPEEWIEKVMKYDPTALPTHKRGRPRPEFLSPKHFLVPLTKAICLNLPEKLKIIIKNEENDDFDV